MLKLIDIMYNTVMGTKMWSANQEYSWFIGKKNL